MTDVFTPQKRKEVMARIKGRNTKPEMLLRKALWKRSCRYRIHSALPGCPDICFPAKKVVIFVDGCFWHRCPLHGNIPATNTAFWEEKLVKNALRDQKITAMLEDLGWKVLRFWEHEIEKDIDRCVDLIQCALQITNDKNKDAK